MDGLLQTVPGNREAQQLKLDIEKDRTKQDERVKPKIIRRGITNLKGGFYSFAWNNLKKLNLLILILAEYILVDEAIRICKEKQVAAFLRIKTQRNQKDSSPKMALVPVGAAVAFAFPGLYGRAGAIQNQLKKKLKQNRQLLPTLALTT